MWKVFLNQAVLGPVVVATFFGWSMTLTGRADEYPAKMRSDAFPALKRGWAFWVPAASVNFALVPLKAQVLYMSCCSIVWNYILSDRGRGGEPGESRGEEEVKASSSARVSTFRRITYFRVTQPRSS